jgi:hypothetical protein|tara:strand:- start:186 stop:467 length:282 start_codon:yes stop_codon:yes gene_type:complete
MTKRDITLPLGKIKGECEDIIDEIGSMQSGQSAADFEDTLLVMKACRDGIDEQLEKLDQHLRGLESDEVEFTKRAYDKWRPESMEEIMKKARS